MINTRVRAWYHNALLAWEAVGRDCFAHFEDPNSGLGSLQVLSRQDSTRVTSQCNTDDQARTLVLVLDEARWLLDTSDSDKTGWFRRFRRALVKANDTIGTSFGTFAGIFAILVDSDPSIARPMLDKISVKPIRDPSSRGLRKRECVDYPPFVVTEAIDVMYDAFLEKKFKQRYLEGKLSTGEDLYWELLRMDSEATRVVLASMGRPLWQRYKMAVDEQTRQMEQDNQQLGRETPGWRRWNDLLDLAATKIVGDMPVSGVAADPSKSLSGVAALLCRLGTRPDSMSSLASRVVADYMAVLSYVGFMHDHLVISYSSEPVLTFGAARVWYSDVPADLGGGSLLERQLLPQLFNLLQQEVLDVGGIGELVARVVLLLAMDATGEVVGGDRRYDGKFHSVSTFLRTLSGGTTEVRSLSNQVDNPPTVDEELKRWESWQVGFSHFVQLSEEPTRDTLLAMLTRRAACILPRNFRGVDLLIPIFKHSDGAGPSDVSMIAIQVKNCVKDPKFPDSATTTTRPKLAFNGDFKQLDESQIVRIYMNLQGGDKMEQYFLVDPGQRSSKRNKPVLGPEAPRPLVLCCEGLSAWSAISDSASSTVEVVDADVIGQLKKILEPWWDLETLVKCNLHLRGARFGMDKEEVMQTAMRPIVSRVVVKKTAMLFKMWKDASEGVREPGSKVAHTRPNESDEPQGCQKRQKVEAISNSQPRKMPAQQKKELVIKDVSKTNRSQAKKRNASNRLLPSAGEVEEVEPFEENPTKKQKGKQKRTIKPKLNNKEKVTPKTRQQKK
ncbi:hypothetical protein Poli38472_004406 [Pythium oligandrum]|uniref:Uncharacterized protein n=1 Tax=Pythium oligandrum TaxID=41045 RepID=A0A8K1CBH0_PYTOL|nr:hypothetical protein Poli38472_004406 [Pythium oligandrum]|eukprot:TMW59337.1 hypothetical protein Poli38472_004406 [Pythium oligandrum]